MSTETQAFLDEMKVPTGKSLIDGRNAVKIFIPEIGQLQEQLSRWSRMAEVAMITETEEGNLEFMRQVLSACQDLIERINQMRHMQMRIIDVGKLIKLKDQDMRNWITNTDPDEPYTGDPYIV